MITPEFLHKLDRFSLIVNKRITSNYVGERYSKETGRGLIFKDHVIYEPGEDFRSVDWRLFGRTDRLFVKRYEEERNLTVHVVLDLSGSMAFGTKVTKAEFASMLGVGFCYLALKNNENFVMSTFSDELEVFRPRKGRAQLATMIAYLNSKKPKGASKLAESLLNYKKLIDSRSYVVIISDFLYPLEQIRDVAVRLKHHQVLMIQVLDQVERKLEIEGDFKLKDMESNETMRTFINPFGRKKYEQMLFEHVSKIKEICDSTGARFYTAHTGQDVFDVFYDIVGKKR